MMDASINWPALDVIAELLDVDDPEGFVSQLFVIKDFAERLRDAQYRELNR